MAHLKPYPFALLIRRMFEELEAQQSIFDLPVSKFVLGDAEKDLSVEFHGHHAATPLGPAAGPQSQMAQNLVLSWLAGCRIMELKTVQIMDELEIPRPCIDMETIGFNVEWSQELKLQESLEEYVKGSMLIEILAASGKIEMAPGFHDTIFDMSVGYDLEGIQSPTVTAFIEGMMDARELVERFRQEIPEEYAQYRDLEFTTCLSDTLTLSTFHGCPPDEIERIIDYLFKEFGLHCIVKLNPMLLGPEDCRQLLNDHMGYVDCHVPDTAFERDTKWDQAVEFIGRLGATAEELNLGFGVKFTNTLIVNNHREFFPDEKEMYLSGPPLHVLAMVLVKRFRDTFGDTYPISFSAGIDRKNFAGSVATGLIPVTTCSDLLKAGGYGRAKGYFKDLYKWMNKVGATDLDSFLLLAYGHAEQALERLMISADDPIKSACLEAISQQKGFKEAAGPELYQAWLSQARILNTDTYVAEMLESPHYRLEKNNKAPRKIGSDLELFDCVTCDKCIPVCPNDANFTFQMPKEEITIQKVRKDGETFVLVEEDILAIDQRHQIANFVDFCNECGNCDVFCPEDGGPYKVKPRFFSSENDWEKDESGDGFYVHRNKGVVTVLARFEGRAYRLIQDGEISTYSGDGFELEYAPGQSLGTITGNANGVVDLTYAEIMSRIQSALLDNSGPNYVRILSDA